MNIIALFMFYLFFTKMGGDILNKVCDIDESKEDSDWDSLIDKWTESGNYVADLFNELGLEDMEEWDVFSSENKHFYLYFFNYLNNSSTESQISKDLIDDFVDIANNLLDYFWWVEKTKEKLSNFSSGSNKMVENLESEYLIQKNKLEKAIIDYTMIIQTIQKEKNDLLIQINDKKQEIESMNADNSLIKIDWNVMNFDVTNIFSIEKDIKMLNKEVKEMNQKIRSLSSLKSSLMGKNQKLQEEYHNKIKDLGEEKTEEIELFDKITKINKKILNEKKDFNEQHDENEYKTKKQKIYEDFIQTNTTEFPGVYNEYKNILSLNMPEENLFQYKTKTLISIYVKATRDYFDKNFDHLDKPKNPTLTNLNEAIILLWLLYEYENAYWWLPQKIQFADEFNNDPDELDLMNILEKLHKNLKNIIDTDRWLKSWEKRPERKKWAQEIDGMNAIESRSEQIFQYRSKKIDSYKIKDFEELKSWKNTIDLVEDNWEIRDREEGIDYISYDGYGRKIVLTMWYSNQEKNVYADEKSITSNTSLIIRRLVERRKFLLEIEGNK